MRMLSRRLPAAQPTEPLECQVELATPDARLVSFASRPRPPASLKLRRYAACSSARSPGAQPPTSAATSIRPGPMAAISPIHGIDADGVLVPHDKDVRRIELPMHERPWKPCQDLDHAVAVVERPADSGARGSGESDSAVRARSRQVHTSRPSARVECGLSGEARRCDLRNPRASPSQAATPIPDRELTDLPQLHAGDLLQQQPLTAPSGVVHDPEHPRSDPRGREHTTVRLELASGLVNEPRLRGARVAKQALPGKILEDQRTRRRRPFAPAVPPAARWSRSGRAGARAQRSHARPGARRARRSAQCRGPAASPSRTTRPGGSTRCLGRASSKPTRPAAPPPLLESRASHPRK